MEKQEIKAELSQALIEYLKVHGGAPAFQVRTADEGDEELARALEQTLPTISGLFLHPDNFNPDGEDRKMHEFRPWIDEILDRMAERLAG